MNLRAGFTRICRFSQTSKHVASDRISPWSFGHSRPAALVRSWSINHRTLSTTNARKLDLANVMVPPEDKDPSNIFRAHLAEGTLTRPLAVSCLQDAVRLNQIDSRVGEIAIKWLWDHYDGIKYPNDSDLINPIAILLVREGKEELLWDWISQESLKPVSDSGHSNLNLRHDWRQAALCALVEAKAHFATDNSLDAALKTFFRGTRVPYLLPTRSAANLCHKMLCRPADQDPQRSYERIRSSLRFPNTSLALWDAFYVWNGKGPKRFAPLLQARMKLYHPQQPDPWPLYKWWQAASHGQDHPLHSITSKKAAISSVEQCRDLRLVLRHLGHHKEADWLKRFLFKLFPRNKQFSGKTTRERLSMGLPLDQRF
ncbi:unnamed protein product [Aureobasidium mustum]|uniref:Uncharacterized protein n=1 Tax=Aureobasidium mustum TaxID=2773714 RepID=A0A9N8K0I9_9PEZI|nr:unnamed protein product [Aureobasidium mustum]